MASVVLKKMHLKGSTLVEVLVSFTVLLFCISMAAMIFVSVARSNGKFDDLDAWISLQNLAVESRVNYDLTEKNFDFHHFQIQRSAVPSSFTPSILILEFKVVDPDNRIRLRYKSLIMKDDAYFP